MTPNSAKALLSPVPIMAATIAATRIAAEKVVLKTELSPKYSLAARASLNPSRSGRSRMPFVATKKNSTFAPHPRKKSNGAGENSGWPIYLV